MRELLTVYEVCTLFKVARSTIYRWISLGKFPPPIHLGVNTTRWFADEVAAVLNGTYHAPTTRG
ncbi:transcriptional regulator [Pelistega indica]|uniref:Transcriptional regulator n=1 Tax=Pelistega indica TaxID=1414851 RepID=V8FSN5_9BURK|nr:AlpA family phage regulatory protein [Pelistega indica]ETD66713.1 transcriptional regulator [Pelistega indica]